MVVINQAFQKGMFGFWNSFFEGAVLFPVSCIQPIITCHFEIPFRDMQDKKFDKINGRKSLFHIDIIFMAVVVEGDMFPIIGIDTAQ